MKQLASTLILGWSLAGCAGSGSLAAPPLPAPEARLLGVAQDGGVPHVHCACPHCAAAAEAPGWQYRVAALAVVAADGRWWLIDATPDFPAQVAEMGGLPAGIFLTHAHVGHYLGLAYLGRETLATRRLPVHCSTRMAAFLRQNDPWRQLLQLDQAAVVEFEAGRAIALAPGLRVTPLPVPHRDELSDTHGFLIEGPGKRLLYVPDIDSWARWPEDLGAWLARVDYALLDGTFYSAEELPERARGAIPHPPCLETIERATAVGTERRAQVVFIHLNHSNPLWDPRAPQRRALPPGFTTGIEQRSFPLR